jgi:sulfur-oxidizing protein SoxY
MTRRASLLLAALLALCSPGQGQATPADPLGSPMWANHAAWLLGKAPVRFDPAVIVTMPDVTENQHVFPVTVDARALPKVQRIVVLMDLNPCRWRSITAGRGAGLRFPAHQAGPAHPGARPVLTADGTGTWPALGRCGRRRLFGPAGQPGEGDWAQHLGEMRGRPGRRPPRPACASPCDTRWTPAMSTISPPTISRACACVARQARRWAR